MAIFFTADTHFGHGNIVRYCGRPFDSLAEHNETMIANWNAIVTPQDHVYHLGDVGFGSPEYLHRVLSRLRGKIHLLRGNHDGPAIREPAVSRFQFVKDVHFLKTQYKSRKIEIFLSHYAHRSWPKSNHGSWHLWGHSHGNLSPHGLSFDVGVDCWGFTPVSLETIAQKISELQVVLDYERKLKESLKSDGSVIEEPEK